ncbi:MAG TPA: hypothetical protein VFF74_09475 [Methylophilaceae bacterium]|nr:hypothetical protein [Methylophilaceae bacterium]
MNLDISSVLEKIQAHLLSWLLPLLGTALSGGALWAEDYLARQVSDPTDIWLIRAIALSVLLLFLLAALWFYFRPKYKFLPDFGINKNLKTGQYFCSPCYIKNKLESPLKTEPHSWFCNVCRQEWDDPSRPPPPPPPQPDLGPHAWMAR